MATPNELVTTEGSTERRFTILPPSIQGAPKITITAEPYETAIIGISGVLRKTLWRKPLHPWTGGLNHDRLVEDDTYASANADCSNEGLLLPPPLLNALTYTNATTPGKAFEFNGSLYINGGRYVVKVDSSYAVTNPKDFGVGKACTDMTVFNNEIVYAMGGSEKIWKSNTSDTYAQATDAVYAQNLAVVDNLLFRSHDTNQVDSCSTTPLTLANWTTAAYKVGDTSFTTTWMGDFGGVLWVGKPDGIYQADPNAKFHSQSPQIRLYPDSENCVNSWVAGGYLWVPAKDGLFRIRLGVSLQRGPEVTYAPAYRFHVRGGFEWNNAIYMLVTDDAAVGDTSIIKMMRPTTMVAPAGHEYIYHQWADLGATTKGYFITVTSKPTNPSIFYGLGNNGGYIKLGRGGGQDIQDANYRYGTAWTLRTGLFSPHDGDTHKDLAVVSTFVGVTAVLNLASANDSVTLAVSTDETAFANLLTTQEGGGTAAIPGATTDWQAITRYAAANTQGQMFEVKVTGATSGTITPSNVPQIRELWAFGFSHPKRMDVLEVPLYLGYQLFRSDPRDPQDTEQLFRRWMNQGTTIQVQIPGYEESQTIRAIVKGTEIEQWIMNPGAGYRPEVTDILKVTLIRVDLAGTYDRAV